MSRWDVPAAGLIGGCHGNTKLMAAISSFLVKRLRLAAGLILEDLFRQEEERLMFGGWNQLAREIEAYCKHRI